MSDLNSADKFINKVPAETEVSESAEDSAPDNDSPAVVKVEPVTVDTGTETDSNVKSEPKSVSDTTEKTPGNEDASVVEIGESSGKVITLSREGVEGVVDNVDDSENMETTDRDDITEAVEGLYQRAADKKNFRIVWACLKNSKIGMPEITVVPYLLG